MESTATASPDGCPEDRAWAEGPDAGECLQPPGGDGPLPAFFRSPA